MDSLKDLNSLKNLDSLKDIKPFTPLKPFNPLKDLKPPKELSLLADLQKLKDLDSLKDLQNLDPFQNRKSPRKKMEKPGESALEKLVNRINKSQWQALVFTENGTVYPYPRKAFPDEMLHKGTVSPALAMAIDKLKVDEAALTMQDKNGNDLSFAVSFPDGQNLKGVRRILFHHLDDWNSHFELKTPTTGDKAMVLTLRQENIHTQKTLNFKENYRLQSEDPQNPATLSPDPQVLDKAPSSIIALSGGKTLTLENLCLKGEDHWQGISVPKPEAGQKNALVLKNTLVLEKVIVEDCHSKDNGGGIQIATGNVGRITKSTFKNNKSEKNGGAIASWSLMAISASAFENNKANDYGGAIFTSPFAYEDPIQTPGAYKNLSTDKNTLFQSNHANHLYKIPDNAKTFDNLQCQSTTNLGDLGNFSKKNGQILNNYDLNYSPNPDPAGSDRSSDSNSSSSSSSVSSGSSSTSSESSNPWPSWSSLISSGSSMPWSSWSSLISSESSMPWSSWSSLISSDSAGSLDSSDGAGSKDSSNISESFDHEEYENTLSKFFGQIFSPFQRNGDTSSSRSSSSRSSASSSFSSSSRTSTSSDQFFASRRSSSSSQAPPSPKDNRPKTSHEDPPVESDEDFDEEEILVIEPAVADKVVAVRKGATKAAPATGGRCTDVPGAFLCR